ncbi:MAG: hypothetical protein V7640_802 [Betaproteobacteria bacterium]|jgi:hypothetical protein
MRNAFLHGLIFGSGFTIAAVVFAVLALFFVPWNKGVASQTSQIMEESTKAFSSADGIKIVNHEKSMRGEEVVVTGQLTNEGQSTARNFTLEVELFDKNKKFVDVCRESFYSSTIKPGETRNFKVSCGGCRNRPTPAHASYTVRVSSSL